MMSDRGLFALGLLVGALAPAFGLFAPALLLALSLISGASDGKRYPLLRRVRSWAPSLIGSLVFPVLVILIFHQMLFDPPGRKDGLTPLIAVAFLSAYAVAFAAITLGVSALTRRSRNARTPPSKGVHFGSRLGPGGPS